MNDALDRDTFLLESLLGEVLEEQEGRAFRDRVFWLRDTAARLRDGDARAGDEIGAFIARQRADALEPYVRACSMQLQLANIAEELERLRRRRHYDSARAVRSASRWPPRCPRWASGPAPTSSRRSSGSTCASS